jgi:hypothetical protein
MQALAMDIVHQGRDNVGGVKTGGERIEITQDANDAAYHLSQSFVVIGGLGFDEGMSLLDRAELKSFVDAWAGGGTHHQHDQAYKADFTSSPSNMKIAARYRQAGSGAS